MRAWWVGKPGPVASHPLVWGERPDPNPGPGDLLLIALSCGVCRTDLHHAEGDLAPRSPHMIPGHEVVGIVCGLGPDCKKFQIGDRVGVPWLGKTCGACRFCLCGEENLYLSPTFTGWDRDGGYAELVTVAEAFAYSIPEIFSEEKAAPLPCSGIIASRALKRAALPAHGRLGIYGFSGSAHITARIALHQGASFYVMTCSAAARALAAALGAVFVGDASEVPLEPLDSAILFPGGRSGAGCPAGTGPRRNPRRGRHPPDRYSLPALRTGAVPGTGAGQRHGQHPSGWPGTLGHRCADPDPADHHGLSFFSRRPGLGRPSRGPRHWRRILLVD